MTRRYPAYRESGIDWLGEVPNHWDVGPLKRRYSVTLGKMLQPEAKSEQDVYAPYLRAANVQWGRVDVSDINSMWFSPSETLTLALEKGDLLVSEGGDVGRSALWDGELEDCYFQNSVNRVRPRENASTAYLYYWMATIKAKGYVDVLCNKSTIAHFTAEKVEAVPVPMPPLPEQTAIAAFLDRETAKIDALVAEQRRLIDLLKEKRQAVISHAVTRGLNPAAMLKPSGVDWLGDVPEGWEVVKLSSKFRAAKGPRGQLLTKEYCGANPGDFPVYSGQTENAGVMGMIGDFDFDAGEDGFLFSTTVGARAMTVSHLRGQFSLSQNCMIIRASSAQALPRFFFYHFQPLFAYFRQQIPEHMQASFRMSDLYEFKIALPPKEEQRAIADKLDAESNRFEALIETAEEGITLLQERRAALISAAVTGKIDVRDLVPQATEAA